MKINEVNQLREASHLWNRRSRGKKKTESTCREQNLGPMRKVKGEEEGD